jgi:hypothetical protein
MYDMRPLFFLLMYDELGRSGHEYESALTEERGGPAVFIGRDLFGRKRGRPNDSEPF